MMHSIANAALIKAIALAVSFFSTVFLVRVMEQSQFGLYTLTITWVTFLSIVVPLGFPQLILRERAGIGRIRRKTLAFTFGAVLVLGLTGFLFARLILQLVEADLSAIIIYASLMLPVWAIIRISSAIISGAGLINVGQIIDTLARPLLLLISAACVWHSTGALVQAITVVELSLITMVLIAVISVWLAWKKRRGDVLDNSDVTSFPPSSFNAALVIAGVSLAQLSMTSLDALVIGWSMSTGDVALYRSAVLQCIAFTSIAEVLNVFLRPKIPEALLHGKTHELESLIIQATKCATYIAFAAWLIYLFLGDSINALIFGERYSDAFLPACILMLGHLLMIGIGPVDTILIMSAKERVLFKILVLGVVPFAVFAWILGQRFGIEGVAIAYVVINVLQRLAGSFWVFRSMGLRASPFLNWR